MRKLLSLAVAIAGILGAQAQRPILGTITEFRVNDLHLGIRPDSGKPVLVKVSADTEVFVVAPGEKDLTKGQPGKLADIAMGDRVLASFVDGLSGARRIVLISATAIARRNASEKLDWQERGIFGIVSSKSDAEVVIEQRSSVDVKHITVAVTPKTKIKRYAADSVRFTDAEPSAVAAISVGDQLRTRGDKSADGIRVTAEDIVFGTFLTKVGSITSVDRELGRVQIQDISTKAPVSIKLNQDSLVRMLPDLRAMFGQKPPTGSEHRDPTAGGGSVTSMSIAKMMEQFPTGSIADLKVGTSIIVTSTSGSKDGQFTAIMLLGNADGLIGMAQAIAAGAGNKDASPMDAISKMHGGVFNGPGGASLPAIF